MENAHAAQLVAHLKRIADALEAQNRFRPTLYSVIECFKGSGSTCAAVDSLNCCTLKRRMISVGLIQPVEAPE